MSFLFSTQTRRGKLGQKQLSLETRQTPMPNGRANALSGLLLLPRRKSIVKRIARDLQAKGLDQRLEHVYAAKRIGLGCKTRRLAFCTAELMALSVAVFILL